MAVPDRRRAPAPKPPPPPDTWITVALEIVRSVLSDRYRTVNAILLVTIPLAMVAGMVITIVGVFIPHPTMLIGALLSSTGVAATGSLRRRLSRRAAALPTAEESDPTPPGPASPPQP